jgi:hypothetical protein
LQQPSPKEKMICRANRFQQKSAPYSKRPFMASCPPSLSRGENSSEPTKSVILGLQLVMQYPPIPTKSVLQSEAISMRAAPRASPAYILCLADQIGSSSLAGRSNFWRGCL